ncbi:MAG: tetratricopeptide repeat protein [Planctomycetaceae bacterium]|nr:tetratricopeptide repeat protein [Planctomycetaceae bacterium]
MSVSATSVEETRSSPAAVDWARRWIISSRIDTLLILLTPLLAIPAVLILSSPRVGVRAATISLIVTAFFATGHHLPGLIRAYGDRELFERFKLRFILAPPLVFLAYFPLYDYHFGLYRLIIIAWATWHGFMQLYGFVRIYDAKVGSTSRATANWDWLVCLCGFVTPQLISPTQISLTLKHWSSLGLPMVPHSVVNGIRWVAVIICLLAFAGFTVNYLFQSYRGTKPNPLKLLMLFSGIGTWWFAMCYVEEPILGIALFDICHDVQYLAIVWLYNSRRVSSNAPMNGFMRYVFRRGMVLLYLGLIVAYGSMGVVAPLVGNAAISKVFYAIIFTSTILHYYYDGFIWKVREPVNQAGLGLAENGTSARGRMLSVSGFGHALKWSPAVVVLGLLFLTDFQNPPLTTSQKTELQRKYSQTLVGRPVLPSSEEEISWLQNEFQAAQEIAIAVPDDRKAQLQSAVMLANFGQNDEAVERLQGLLEQHPDYRDAHVVLGEIHSYRGNIDQAASCFEKALSLARTGEERSAMNLRLGEIALQREDFPTAKKKFAEAVQDDPQLAASVESLQEGNASGTYP